MPNLNAPLPNEPIFHHAEPRFAQKLNQMADALREIQDYLNAEGEPVEADKPLTAAQRKKLEAEQKAAKEAALKEAEEAEKAKQDAANT